MQSLKRTFYNPSSDSEHPLALFHHCDNAVLYQMNQLSQLMKTVPDNLDRRSQLIRQLKDSQHSLLNVLMYMVDTVLPEGKTAREFQAKYPDDLPLDQIYGPIWFGAECLAAGSHIANREIESQELRPYAIRLSKSISRLRNALRLEGHSKNFRFTAKIKQMLKYFDKSWVDFEFRYVSVMCTVQTETQYLHQQEIAVLFSEATQRALQLKYFSKEDIEMMDPAVMFAIPRLAIICGIVIFPDGPINPERPSRDTPACFRGYRQLLARIKELLGFLTKEQLMKLERALCSAEGLRSLEDTPSMCSDSGTRPQSSISTSSEDSSFTDQSSVFDPEITVEMNEVGLSSDNNETGSIITSELSTSHITPNTLPNSIFMSSPTQQSLTSLKPGQAGFISSIDLPHRLFIAISGVADQLQTNYPRDFRAILKQVFTIITSDVLLETNGSKHGGKHGIEFEQSHDIFWSQGLDLSLSSMTDTFSSTSSNKWVSDSQSPICYGCEERFSLFRRRHHCRACGQVVCSRCSPHSLPLGGQVSNKLERVCHMCYVQELGKATQMLSARMRTTETS